VSGGAHFSGGNGDLLIVMLGTFHSRTGWSKSYGSSEHAIGKVRGALVGSALLAASYRTIPVVEVSIVYGITKLSHPSAGTVRIQ
jgi:hypothetical protein